MWQQYFDKTLVVSLEHRSDRREKIDAQFFEYGIEYEYYPAIRHDRGAYGLMLTMKQLFKECLDAGLNNVLVFEDDCKIIEPLEIFNLTMEGCVNDLKNIQWDCFYLGLQHTRPFGAFKTYNLLPVTQGYSTQSVAYSRKAMEFFLSHEFDMPIDNFFVQKFQKYNTCYCCYPFLTTQYTNYSDIGKEIIDWDRYMSKFYREHVASALHTRNF